ncbi:GDSL Lipase/Acylhydrolase family protein [Coniochaeta hoffmannii]|uniref:GDSL Lipase/Acylhydrolase family protein n=1 Tax=Coniochaeta hoffmannii TaxID=91930 RepID=A0AA38RXM7_9PEZI|nr:GDSL Lipase/Acylhydrolase family protein [Coniochaeta hoffmannii]
MAVPWPQVVLFGDSLFQASAQILDGFAFQAALQEHVNRRFDVVNRGLSGYNTSQALKALPRIFRPASADGPQIKYLLVLFGANDACVPLPTNDQHVPLDEFRRNLAGIITHPTILSHRPKILLVTPPPLDEIRITTLDLALGHPSATRRAKVSASYSQAVREIAAEHEDTVTLIDLWKGVMDRAVEKTLEFDPRGGKTLGDPDSGLRGYLEHLLPDGLHMSGESYRVFFELVKGHIGREWAGTAEEERVGYVLPDWRVAPKLEH